jgi:predicted double-glycine peptidase
MLMGLKKFAVFGFVATMVLTTPLSRVPQKRNRIMISILMAVIVFFMSIWPFLAPMVDRNQLSHLTTHMDGNGVCLQETDYTCGPASAVTALRKLGLPAEEGEIAISSCTSFQEGTPTDMLADALQKEYAKDGLIVECRAFKNISELKQAGLTLAVIKYNLIVDHWVTVLEVTESQVVIGDPLGGLQRISYEEFEKKWRFEGIVLKRKT